MKEYTIEVCETLARIITIEAKSADEAYEKVSTMYRKEEIVLDYNDYLDTQIKRI